MNTCCFTGHRAIASAELPALKQRLVTTIETLIGKGVVFFGCGGAIGFDMLAGFTVLELKEKYPTVKLIMILPCRNQDEKWSEKDKAAYQKLLAAADRTIYLAEQYYDGCMRERNLYLVNNSEYCIAYLKRGRSGTSQTVRCAKERGLIVYNLADL